MKLNELSPAAGSNTPKKRVGRGYGSGLVKTSGRGTKGQKARSGGSVRPGFEGGQMPIHRRLPKRGFKNPFKKVYAIINVNDLNLFEAGMSIDENSLVKAGLVKGQRDGIKLLGNGEIGISLTVKVHAVSRSAQKKIEAVGGKVEVL